uniref:Uncharacterized protein n=1 Tax=Podoviridae sp. ctWeH21 TaxID=2825255 RepID=A0A8S5PHD0_9CAUD|nr:MAG TPA: hypothetical protein [Podoviridae sp. ctWeH21]
MMLLICCIKKRPIAFDRSFSSLYNIIVSNVADYDLKIYEVTNRYPMISNMAFCHLRGLKVTDLVPLGT